VPGGGARKAGIRQNHREQDGWRMKGVSPWIDKAHKGSLELNGRLL
jgi:hypothetical protein